MGKLTVWFYTPTGVKIHELVATSEAEAMRQAEAMCPLCCGIMRTSWAELS